MGSRKIFLKSSNYFGRVTWPNTTLSYPPGKMCGKLALFKHLAEKILANE